MDEPPAPRRTWLGPVAVASVMAAAGLLFTTTAQTAKGTPLRAQSADLAALVESQSAEQKQKVQELAALQQEYRRLSEQGTAGNATLEELREQEEALQPAAGLSPVTGPGLEVTLDDAPRSRAVPPGAGPDDLVVHQQDVQAVVNALWAGGATAMTLMDQRVISTSAVRCVGNTLILQGRVYSPPYTIRATGDVTGMAAALDASPDLQIYQQYVAAMGLVYDEKPLSTLEIPAYEGSLSLSHAKEIP